MDNVADRETRSDARLQTISSVITCRTEAELARKELAMDLSETLQLVKANIPLERLDHPAVRDFIERRIPGAGAIPLANTVRQWYLPSIQAAHRQELQEIMDESDGVVITVDESSDNVTERSVVNLVLTPINVAKAEQDITSYIADQIYVDELDHKVVAREVIKIIDAFNIPHENVIAYVCDNVAYMSKAFTLFSAFYENCVLITCTGHLFHLLFQRLSVFGSEVHNFMSKWQAYFKNSVRRKKRFGTFIESKGLPKRKCPKPCTTRWTPWLKAVEWHSERHRFLQEFFNDEKGHSDTPTLEELSSLLHGCKKPVAEVAVLPEKNSNQAENFWKNKENFMRF